MRVWQADCLKHLFHQPQRKICWYLDEFGGVGESFLAHLLYFAYQFELFDGITCARDITSLISDFPRGFVFDVTRSDNRHFSHNTLEMVKTGFIMTGKYMGIRRTYSPVPVIVFANFSPEEAAFSADRLCIHHVEASSQSALQAHTCLPFPPYPPQSVSLDSPEKEGEPEAL